MGQEIFNLEKGNITIRISNSCQANCSGCHYGRYNNREFKTRFVESKDIHLLLDRFFQLTKRVRGIGILSDDISFYQPLDTILKEIKKSKKSDYVYISGEENISEEYKKRLSNIDTDRLIYFINSFGNNQRQIIDFLKKIDYIDIPKDIVIDLDFKKEQKFIALLLKYFGKFEILKNGNFLSKDGILLENKNHLVSKEKTLEEVRYNHCLLNGKFQIQKEQISISNYMSLEVNGDMYFHRMPCMLGSYKGFPITNIFQTRDKIIKDYIRYESFLKEKDATPMIQSCKDCIKNPFNYRMNL